MQLCYTCRRCGRAVTVDSQNTQPLRGAAASQPHETDRPILGYLALCPHCGTDNLVRPHEARPP